tara:strand:- start:234 stop:578 length:345 start_codon:yes stop_codon:yes gene_type:complete
LYAGFFWGVNRHYKLAAPGRAFSWTPFVARKMTPRSRKSGNGLLLGCRSALDRGSDKKTYFGDAQKEMGKNGGNLHRLFGYLISIDRGWSNQWVASLVVRESRERRGKIFAGKT